MARPLRLQFEGATYHITARGNERKTIFRNDAERMHFLGLLGEVVERYGWLVYAWTLMGNHYHLVIETPHANLSAGMQWLNSKYGAFVNRRRRRVGHLFQGRFKSVLIEKQAHMNEVIRYTVLNPVRAGMVAHPGDYRWSSYRACAGIDKPLPWLHVDWLYALDEDPCRAHQIYTRFVDEKIGSSNTIWEGLVGQVYLGSEEWIAAMRERVEAEERSDEHPKAHRLIPRTSMERVITAVADACGVAGEEICRRGGGVARMMSAWIGWQYAVLRLRDIGGALRLRSSGYVSQLISRCRSELARDPLLRDRCQSIVESLRTGQSTLGQLV